MPLTLIWDAFFQDKKIFSWLTRNVYSSVCSWWRDVKRTFRQNGCLNFQLLIRIPNFFEFHLIPPLRLFHLQLLQPPVDKHHPPFLNNLEENQEQILPGLVSRLTLGQKKLGLVSPIVAKKWEPRNPVPSRFSAQIRKVEARLGKLAKIRKVETN